VQFFDIYLNIYIYKIELVKHLPESKFLFVACALSLKKNESTEMELNRKDERTFLIGFQMYVFHYIILLFICVYIVSYSWIVFYG
jgi:hypothetical protein